MVQVMRNALMTAGALLMACVCFDAQGVSLAGVQGEPLVVGPENSFTVRFTLDEPAFVELRIYDAGDALIRTVASQGLMPAGDNSLSWRIDDERGERVPEDAYAYTLAARTERGAAAVFDPTDDNLAEPVSVDGVRWNPETGRVTYVLGRPARVKLRVGLDDNGPLLAAIVNMAARPAGVQEESWDGLDATGSFPLGRHPKLAVGVTTYALPRNSIIVGRAAQAATTTGSPQRRSLRQVSARASLHPSLRRDYRAVLRISDSRSIPSVAAGSVVPVVIDVPPEMRQLVLSQRFEPVFFVDGVFVFENEVGFLPLQWTWKPTEADVGERTVTVNLRGYDGAFGIVSVKVRVTTGRESAP
jgi:hypothetical protein